MHRIFLILIFLICIVYSFKEENKVCNNSKPAAIYDLKQFEESAEEFIEQFNCEAFDPDIILGNEYEFLEDTIPIPFHQVPSLTENHANYTNLFIPDYIYQKVFYQKTDRVIPSIDEYSLILPEYFYHPPQI